MSGVKRTLLPVRQQAGHLSAQQRESLEGDGYLLVSSVLDETVLGPIASRLEELVRHTVAAWDTDSNQAVADQVEQGVVRAKLDLTDPVFAPCCGHPLLPEAATAVLGANWHLAALNLRAPLPGCGHQAADVWVACLHSPGSSRPASEANRFASRAGRSGCRFTTG